jgi:hypothetical protein
MRKFNEFQIKLIILCLSLLSGGMITAQDIADVKNQKPITIHGNAGLNLMGYAAGGIEARQEPFSWVLSANATVSLYGIDLPFSITLSDKQKSYSQPFNQFGLSPHYKWITVYLGYRNVTWSPFTLGGHTFVGAGFEVNPSILRAGFIWGRFDRPTTYNTTDSVNPLPVFARKGFAAKLGVGTDKNFFDLILLRIRDDSTSAQQPDTGAIRTPEQNLVAGFNSKFTFLKKLTWETEAAVSLYTTNTGAQQLSEIEENQTLSTINKFLGINQSSEYSTAIRSSLNYKGKGYTLKLEYKRIDPYYRSFGSYFFNNDVQNLTFSPTFSLFKRKVTVGGSIGLQNDNLKKTKKATSQRRIGTVNISVNPVQKFGIDLGYSNYSIRQKAGTMPLSDSVKVNQANQSVTVAPRLMLMGSSISHSVLINYNYTFLRDKNPITTDLTRCDIQVAQLNYVAALIRTQWSFTAGLTWNSVDNFNGKTTGFGGTLGVSKPFLKGKLNLAWNNACMHSGSSGNTAWVINSNILGAYTVNRHHSLKLSLYYTGNFTGAGSASPTFNEFKGDMSYVFTF